MSIRLNFHKGRFGQLIGDVVAISPRAGEKSNYQRGTMTRSEGKGTRTPKIWGAVTLC